MTGLTPTAESLRLQSVHRALWSVAGAIAGYIVGVAVVIAATIWGHLVNFEGFGMLRGAVFVVMVALVGGWLGFLRAYKRDLRGRPLS
jgi:hypothetical protein